MSELEAVVHEGQVAASALAQADERPIRHEGQVVASALAQADECPVRPTDGAAPAAWAPGRAEVARPEFVAAGVAASDCGCGCGGGTKAPQPVKAYVIGQVGYDFATEARRDSFLQAMGREVVDPQALLAYLKENPYEATRLTWTLMMESTPIYAIQAAGPYADVAYQRLVSYLEHHLQGHADLSSIPGFIAGTTALMAGQTVPVIVPVVRGMYNWTTSELLAKILGEKPTQEEHEAPEVYSARTRSFEEKSNSLQNFLDRVYYEFKNLGVKPEDRAINYAGTNLFQAREVFEQASAQSLQLEAINVAPSMVCRPESECYDVQLRFFDPGAVQTKARRLFLYTVDVSDVIPVSVGKVRTWSVF